MADFEWTNNGSCRDVTSQVLPAGPVSALAPTSQHGGNQIWANNAHTAPGGNSGDLGNDLNEAVVVDAPVIEAQPVIKPGTDGKPPARSSGSYTAPAPAWAKTSVPDVVREQ
jgi:hypothetical protein